MQPKKRGAKHKPVKGEMLWIPDYLVSAIKKLKQIDMTYLKENFAKGLEKTEQASLAIINSRGVKLLDEMTVYRSHIVIPTSTPDGDLFGFIIVAAIDGEEVDINQDTDDPQNSLAEAIAIAKKQVDNFYTTIINSDIDHDTRDHFLRAGGNKSDGQ